ncbi:MAG: CBS domain-containing protein [Saccharolobus sp.]
MLDNGFRHLPIVNDKGKVSGIVSIRDLVKALTDSHYYQFGKELHEVKNSGIVCPVCGLEIDEMVIVGVEPVLINDQYFF